MVMMHLATLPASMLKQKPRHVYYAGQKKLLLFVIIILAVLPLVGITWQTSNLYQESWLTRTGAELSSSAQSRKELVDLFLGSQEDMLESVVEQYDRDALSRKQNLARIFAAINRSGVMTDVGVIDTAGTHLAYVGPFAEQLAGRNYAAAPWFAKVMQTGRYISDIFTGYRNVPHLIVAVTNRDKSMILRATINSAMFNGLLASANVGPDGDAFIISGNGELQTQIRLGIQRMN
ncbi:MAG: cache domain-containing protein, partial [Desulfobulbaceae bacterium]